MFPTWYRVQIASLLSILHRFAGIALAVGSILLAGGCLPCLPIAATHAFIASPLGYALLGAGWLILKSEGALQDWAWKRIPWLAGAALAVVCVAFIIALGDRDRISGALHERTWGLVFPLLTSWRYTSSS
jgi:cytochrome bd-type quinol oxidase subunit 2